VLTEAERIEPGFTIQDNRHRSSIYLGRSPRTTST
jgi:hypothetical protein